MVKHNISHLNGKMEDSSRKEVQQLHFMLKKIQGAIRLC